MPAYDNMVEIITLVQETLKTLGVPNLPVKTEWNTSFTRRMGDAEYIRSKGYGVVRFSVPLWPLASPEARKETVIHEVCHVVNSYFSIAKSGWGPVSSHGYQWQSLMIQCGVKPERCHSVERPPELKRKPQEKFVLYCKCREHKVTQTILKRMTAGTKYKCKQCDTHITKEKHQ